MVELAALLGNTAAIMEAIKAAAKDPTSKFVVVIEEINRGNPALGSGLVVNDWSAFCGLTTTATAEARRTDRGC